MGEGNISNNPLSVILEFYSNTANANSDNANYTQTTTSLVSVLPLLTLLSPTLQAELAPLEPYLTVPLGIQLNTQWFGIQAAEETAASAIFEAQASAAGQSVNSVTTTFPATGTLMGFTYDAVAGTSETPAEPPRLSLEFLLPGSNFHFEKGSLTAWYKINFDASFSIFTTVPVLPFSLNPTLQAVISNANLQADSFWANVEAGLDDLLTDLGNLFTQSSNYESDWNLAQAGTDAGTDGTYSLPGGALSQFLTLLATLNSAGPEVVALRFTRCAFSIANSDTLTLTLTHPLDAGPKPNDPSAPQGTVLSTPALLSASEVQVKPGQTITAYGTNFPVASVSEIPIAWPNTSSGTPAGAQIKYEITGQNTGTPIAVPLAALSNGVYSYTANSLTANSEYSFWARCGDQLTWSKWSGVALKVKTANTTLVKLLLRSVNDPSGAGVVVGSANLSQTSTDWTAQAQIPSATAVGVYNLIAELSGVQIANTQITVSNTLQPALFIIDPQTQAVITSPVLMGGSPFTIKGEQFPPGVVAVTLDGTIAGMPNAPAGEFLMALNVPGDANSGYQTVTVTAASGVASVTLSFQAFGPPK